MALRIEPARRAVDRIVTFDDGFVELPDRGIVEEGAAAFILPGAGHRRDAQRRMHLRGAIAAAAKAVTEAEEGAPGLTDEAGKGFDFFDRHARDRGSPFRRACL